MTTAPPFFVAGGTVPPGSPSYVERTADRELFEALLAGEFCFVLNSRQMGKSSLAVRTIARLNETGVRTAFVDLTRLGATGADPERWYASLLIEFGRALGLRAEAMAYVKANPHLTPAGRLFGFLADEVLNSPLPSGGEGLGVRGAGQPLVIFIDEVDATRTLPFSADDLFAGLRQAWNARAESPAYRRLAFCLMGAALPSDLIRDPRVTPFNVGRRVDLRDFTPEEARPFAAGLASPFPRVARHGGGAGGGGSQSAEGLFRGKGPGDGGEILARVLHWTGGHPFLTQALCAELAASPSPSGSSWRGGQGGEAAVDALVRARYLDARARDSDTNLADVGNRLLGTGDPDVTDAVRAETLTLYERILKGKPVADDEANPSAARIKMSGVARLEGGLLKPRNKIYAAAFDARWVKDNMPGGELRRQRRAFYKGVLRTGLVSAAVLSVVSILAAVAIRNAARATRAEALAKAQRDAARYDAYVASMQTMDPRDADGDLPGIRRTLASLKDNPARGWEWDYWNHAVHHGATRLDWDGTNASSGTIASPSSPYIAVADRDALTVYDAATGRRLRRIRLPHSLGHFWKADLFRDGRRALLLNSPQNRLLIVDLAAGRIVRRRDLSVPLIATPLSVDQWDSRGDRFTFVQEAPVAGSDPRLLRLDLDTLRTAPVPGRSGRPPLDVWELYFEASGQSLASRWADARGSFVSVLRVEDLKEIHRIPIAASADLNALGPRGSEVLVADGRSLIRLATATGKPLGSLPTAGTIAVGGRYAPDGRRLLLSTGKTVEEVDIAAVRPRLLRTLPLAANAFYLPNGRLLLDRGFDLMILGAPGGRTVSEVHLPGASNVAFCHSADGRIALTSPDRFITIDADRPLASPATLRNVSGLADVSGRFTLDTAVARRRVSDLRGEHAPFWVPRTWSYVQEEFAGSPDGRRVVLPASATNFVVYDTASGTLVASLGVAFPSAARFSDDGKWLATGDAEGNLALWDARSWKRILSVRLGPSEVIALAFSNDGARVAGGMAGGLGVLDLRNVSVVRLSDASPNVYAVAWSHDGRRLASAGDDRRVRLWDPAAGRDLGAIGTHGASVVGVWFTSDDRTLCSVDIAGTLKLWRTSERP